MVSKFENKTVEELKEICRQKNITGYSKLKKEDLIKLVKKNSKRKNVKVKKSKKGGANNNKLIRTDDDIHKAVNEWCSNPAEAETKYGHISQWDVSRVTNMKELFKWKNAFNDDISGWDVSNVTDMGWMFCVAKAFNQPIGNWDVSKVSTMEGMFWGAAAFNQPIGSWDVSKVTNMKRMFEGAEAFNQPIGSWDVSKVTNMRDMFYVASSFNQPIGRWNVSKVSTMEGMFYGARAFNQPIGSWDISNVTSYENIFENCPIQVNYKPKKINKNQLDIYQQCLVWTTSNGNKSTNNNQINAISNGNKSTNNNPTNFISLEKLNDYPWVKLSKTEYTTLGLIKEWIKKSRIGKPNNQSTKIKNPVTGEPLSPKFLAAIDRLPNDNKKALDFLKSLETHSNANKKTHSNANKKTSSNANNKKIKE